MSSKGIVAKVDDMVNLVTAENTATFWESFCALSSLFDEWIVSGKLPKDCRFRGEIGEVKIIRSLIDPIVSRKQAPKAKYMRTLLKKMMNLTEKDSAVGCDEMFTETWRWVLEDTYSDFPELEEIEYFENSRECGWEVPLNEFVFIFSSWECFKQVPTKKGSTLKKAFKWDTLCETEWTSVSY